MIREVMQNAGLWHLPAIALILFFGTACAIGLWVYRRDGKKMYDEMALIPFSDEPGEAQEERS